MREHHYSGIDSYDVVFGTKLPVVVKIESTSFLRKSISHIYPYCFLAMRGQMAVYVETLTCQKTCFTYNKVLWRLPKAQLVGINFADDISSFFPGLSETHL